jgi:transcriptional regulator with XRE-family HTH domain
MQRGLRQYEAAQAAGVTKAMLSAYETGKRRPSLKTLDSLLTAMDADLGDLHRALMSHRREVSYLASDAAVPRRWDIGEPELEWATRPPGGAGCRRGPVDVHDLLGLREPLPAEEEQALAEMLHGFLKLLRFMHHGPATGGGRLSRGAFDGG